MSASLRSEGVRRCSDLLDAVDYGGASTELLRAGFKTCSAGLAFDGRVQGCWGVSPSLPTWMQGTMPRYWEADERQSHNRREALTCLATCSPSTS